MFNWPKDAIQCKELDLLTKLQTEITKKVLTFSERGVCPDERCMTMRQQKQNLCVCVTKLGRFAQT